MNTIPSTPEAPAMTAPALTLTPAQLAEARDWIADCFDDVDASTLTDAQVERGIARHYAGGIEAFRADTATLTDEAPAVTETPAPAPVTPGLPAGTRVRCLRTGDTGTTATAYDPSGPWLSPSSDPRRASVSFVADSPLRGHSPQRDELVSDLVAL